MNYGESGGGLSASDVALLTGNGGNNNGFGNGDWSWIIIFVILALLGWGGNGFGNSFGGGNGGYNACCTPATQQGLSDAFNFGQLDNGVRSLANGLCDGFYAVNTSILNLGQTLLQCCLKIVGNLIRNNKQAVIA